MVNEEHNRIYVYLFTITTKASDRRAGCLCITSHKPHTPCVRLLSYFMSNILLFKRVPFDVNVYTYVPEASREASNFVL